jgi:hypothetical protein
MRRLHLFEIEDQPWCPEPIRDGLTDYLRYFLDVTDMYRPIAPRLRAALKRMGTRRIVDLCSGGSGPWGHLLRHLEGGTTGALQVLLTDLYPNRKAFEWARRQSGGRLEYEPQPVNATRVPEHLEGFRTLFTAFHHFRPELAREILRDAVRKQRGIGIFEFTRRNIPASLRLALRMPFTVLAAPLSPPFRWSRLLWTYVVPAIPAMAAFDGFVSSLRSYTPDELRDIVAGLGDTNYIWDIGQEPAALPEATLTWLIGYPQP